jgi:hypothetical protein
MRVAERRPDSAPRAAKGTDLQGSSMHPGRLELPPRLHRTRPSTLRHGHASCPIPLFSCFLSTDLDVLDASDGMSVVSSLSRGSPHWPCACCHGVAVRLSHTLARSVRSAKARSCPQINRDTDPSDPSLDASTPAAQIALRAAIRSVEPSGATTATASSSIATTVRSSSSNAEGRERARGAMRGREGGQHAVGGLDQQHSGIRDSIGLGDQHRGRRKFAAQGDGL